MNEKLLTPQEASELLNVTTHTLRNWSIAGKIRAYVYPVSGRRMYPEKEILRMQLKEINRED
ncbi:MAG: helix-turn-helix domain-containing protein [Firmicutes bacterium]|nr:helix-turn-helix domain-containing protein [Bacillota bacterium]